jgi:orotidine-5'-phosphate decarboxylase
MNRKEARSKLIFALDVDSFSAAELLVTTLNDRVGMFKVGKQLFTAHGPDIVRMIRRGGAEIFLDLKYHDIPNTVAMASLEAARLGVTLFNLHALGGYEMMARTAEALGSGIDPAARPKVLAVTILTSSTSQTLSEVGITLPVEEMVVKLALLAQRAGIDGVVASPREVSLIRDACGPGFLVVTPGVRPSIAALDDQKRTMTPAEAIRQGADYIVVGRPISAAAEPAAAADRIVDEIVRSTDGE